MTDEPTPLIAPPYPEHASLAATIDATALAAGLGRLEGRLIGEPQKEAA